MPLNSAESLQLLQGYVLFEYKRGPSARCPNADPVGILAEIDKIIALFSSKQNGGPGAGQGTDIDTVIQQMDSTDTGLLLEE